MLAGFLFDKENKMTPEEILEDKIRQDKELNEIYSSLKDKCRPYEKGMIPKSIMTEMEQFFNMRQFNMYDLRMHIIPHSIVFMVEANSLLRHLQSRVKTMRK